VHARWIPAEPQNFRSERSPDPGITGRPVFSSTGLISATLGATARAPSASARTRSPVCQADVRHPPEPFITPERLGRRHLDGATTHQVRPSLLVLLKLLGTKNQLAVPYVGLFARPGSSSSDASSPGKKEFTTSNSSVTESTRSFLTQPCCHPSSP
jgi:hypothetical protein